MKSASEIERTARRIRFGPDPSVNERILHHAKTALEKSRKPETVQINVRSWRRFQRLVWAGGLAAAFLIIFSLVIALVRSKEVTDLKAELELARQDVALARRDISIAPTDNSATINLYFKEHRDVVARHASFSPAQPEPIVRPSQSRCKCG